MGYSPQGHKRAGYDLETKQQQPSKKGKGESLVGTERKGLLLYLEGSKSTCNGLDTESERVGTNMTSRFGQSRKKMCHNTIGFNSYT